MMERSQGRLRRQVRVGDMPVTGVCALCALRERRVGLLSRTRLIARCAMGLAAAFLKSVRCSMPWLAMLFELRATFATAADDRAGLVSLWLSSARALDSCLQRVTTVRVAFRVAAQIGPVRIASHTQGTSAAAIRH